MAKEMGKKIRKFKERKKENNAYNIDYSHPGICTLCYEEIGKFTGEFKDNKYQVSHFKNNCVPTQLKLSDGSLMTVNLCTDCRETLDSWDLLDIISNEIVGWKRETDYLVKVGRWTKKQAKDYMDRYRNLSIEEVTK